MLMHFNFKLIKIISSKISLHLCSTDFCLCNILCTSALSPISLTHIQLSAIYYMAESPTEASYPFTIAKLPPRSLFFSKKQKRK